MKKEAVRQLTVPFDRKKMEAEVSRRKHDFDMISLLRLLFFMGYSPEEITFKSYNSLCSQNGLIEKIQFQREPFKNVILTLNMGLLSAQSTLPSYFQKVIDRGLIDLRSFYSFIGYFDHTILFKFFELVYPELNLNRLFSLEQMNLNHIQMLDLRSCSTLDWLFRLVFPELDICVDKGNFPRQVAMNPLKLGNAILGGNAVFGDKTSIVVSGRNVKLFCDEELTSQGSPWAIEIKKRLKNEVFPILSTIGIDLQVTLVIKDQKQWARLNRASYLGYDKIIGNAEQDKQIRIFKGYIASS
ncbi:MAG: hypothetical protein GY710_04910 [Desulfobacteraceae bacterium]|nr:hypothetical protein [Desulfobacteraceae bacterium]